MSDVWNDLRYSARSLTRTPVWTVTLMLTLALGIGSRASVQGFVRGLLTTKLPAPGIETVVSVFAIDEQGGARQVSFADFASLRERGEIFDALGAIRERQERVSIGKRSTLMSVAEFTPAIGALLPLPNRDGVALSYRVRFADFDPRNDPVGLEIAIGGRTALVSGMLPDWLEGLHRGQPIDLWLPASARNASYGAAESGDSGAASLWLLGRLRPGVSIAAAQAAINTDRAGALAILPYTGLTPEAAAGMVRIGTLLSAAATAVFLIACANVASFLLSRSSARARETAVRVAIGARRRQLARQLLVDSVLVSAIGGAAGFILAMWMADVVPLLFFDQQAQQLVFAPDTRGIVLTAMACVAITVACGLAPLLEMRHDVPSVVLQREVAGPSRMTNRLGSALVLAQMVGCTVLVIATGLLLQGFRAALQTSAGQRVGDPVLASGEALNRTSRAELSELGLGYFADLERAARLATEVSGSVWFARLPGARPAWQELRFDRPSTAERHARLDVVPLTPRAVESIAVPPKAGRLYSVPDAGRCGGAVINEEAAHELFEGNPIGRVIVSGAGRPLEVVGVVADEASVATLYEYPERAEPVAMAGPAEFRAPVAMPEATGLLDVNIVSTNYFNAMGLARVDGRLFEAVAAGCRIGVVNEEAAAAYFDGHAIGAAVIDGSGRRTEIVGVVRSAQLTAGQRRAAPSLYLPMSQDFVPRMSVLLDTPSASRSIVERIRRRMAVVPGGRSDRLVVTTLEDHLAATALAPFRIASVLVGVFAVIALTLGMLGLYGVMADTARRRRREFAVRLALGAQGWRVVRQLMREGMTLAGAGVAAGMAASFLVARWLATITPGAGSPSLMVLLAAPVLLTTAVLLATVVPARHALSVDLLSIMRE